MKRGMISHLGGLLQNYANDCAREYAVARDAYDRAARDKLAAQGKLIEANRLLERANFRPVPICGPCPLIRRHKDKGEICFDRVIHFRMPQRDAAILDDFARRIEQIENEYKAYRGNILFMLNQFVEEVAPRPVATRAKKKGQFAGQTTL
jgi:hypothetical protein